jgi:hypothetical protein
MYLHAFAKFIIISLKALLVNVLLFCPRSSLAMIEEFDVLKVLENHCMNNEVNNFQQYFDEENAMGFRGIKKILYSFENI